LDTRTERNNGRGRSKIAQILRPTNDFPGTQNPAKCLGRPIFVAHQGISFRGMVTDAFSKLLNSDLNLN
jgi:hypothetical protein